MNNTPPNINFSKIETLNYRKLNLLNNKVYVKRDDLIHPIISGNKWRKLKYNIEDCFQYGYEGIVTFGGAFSNHLIATAEACKLYKLKSIAFVRGEELNPFSNMILQECYKKGMDLRFISRASYKEKKRSLFFEEKSKRFLSLPEGGSGFLGIKGCMEILNQEDGFFDWVVLAQGTTTTSIGVLLSIPMQTKLLVVPALKGFNAISEMKEQMKNSNYFSKYIDLKLKQVRVASEYHFGGFAKTTPALLSFRKEFLKESGINIDKVYNSKALFALKEILKNEKWENQKILYIHTGGYE
ncbi:MAG: pyridoxal-phosphate dependent enzyme [Crocinitomicaceae bacterium]|nr:pyridoxal-phosphate dependent enzyme [Crocinitomicaceae bacterium]